MCNMIILIHVLIAITSILHSGYVYMRPSKRRINASYGLVAATLISGTYLVVSTGSPILSSCVTGLVYLGFALFGIIAARYKLAAQED